MTLSLFSNLVSSIFHINLLNLDVHSALKTSLLISKINFHVTENKLEKKRIRNRDNLQNKTWFYLVCSSSCMRCVKELHFLKVLFS